MSLYAAWMRLPEKGEGKGCFVSYRQQIVVAQTAEEIAEAFGGIAEPVELSTVNVSEWLKRDSLTLDTYPRQVGPVPTPDELRASSRWRPTDPQIKQIL